MQFNMTKLAEAAASMKEMHETFVEQGFTKQEALTIITEMARPRQLCDECKTNLGQ